MVDFCFSINSRKTGRGGMKLGLSQTVSRKPINFASEERIKDLKKLKLKKRTEAKMNWGVAAFND